MEIREIIRLADWFDEEADKLISLYSALTNILQHNAQQASSQPVKDPLEELTEYLRDMPTEQISTLQFRILGDLETDQLIGQRGAQWINETVKSTTYDPATTYSNSQQALQKIQETRTKLNAFRSSSEGIGITRTSYDTDDGDYLINIVFQNDVAISNIRDWKKTASDWDQIVSGISGAVGEKPEDTAVVGVSNGSIIVTLGATAAVTKILATISKHITSIAHDILSIRLKAEELRQMKMTTKNMENEFKLIEKTKRDDGLVEIKAAIAEVLPDLAPEVSAKLDNSIKKALAFGEAGGELDFVVPEDDIDDDDVDEELTEEFELIRGLVEEQQKMQQEVKLLTGQTER